MAIVLPNSVSLEATLVTEGNNPWIGIDNRVTFSNITADSEAENYPVIHLANAATDPTQRWVAADTDECVITVDTTDSPLDIDYIGIAGHNLGSALCTIKVEFFIVDTWVEVITERYLGADEPALFRVDKVNPTSVRITIGSGDVAAYISVLNIGTLTVIPTRVYVGFTPLRFGRITSTVSSRNQRGNFLGRVVTGERFATSVEFKNLVPDWVRGTFFDTITSMQESPFFFAWRPVGYPEEVAYAWVPSGQDPRPVNQRSNGMMSATVNMEGII